jgi:hypothetical protein
MPGIVNPTFYLASLHIYPRVNPSTNPVFEAFEGVAGFPSINLLRETLDY